MAENLDSQLKQMSDDLKEVIEHLNEATKTQELQDPVSKVSFLLVFFCTLFYTTANITTHQKCMKF